MCRDCYNYKVTVYSGQRILLAGFFFVTKSKHFITNDEKKYFFADIYIR